MPSEEVANLSILTFIHAVIHRWVVLMSGGIVTVALGIFERVSGRNIPLWAYVCVLIAFAFSACYLAWRDAQRKLAKKKPDINGEVKTVYFVKIAKLVKSDSEHMHWDFHFTIHVYLANHGAPTTIEQFKLRLKSNERWYDGEKESDPEFTALGAVEHDDIEKDNDESLEHTRRGWLRFVVREVQAAKNESEMELELYVIDKDKTLYPLTSLPQFKWEANPVEIKQAKARSFERARRKF